MKVEIGGRARRQVERFDAWWRKNRDKAPELFEQELAKAEEFLATTPHLARQYVVRRGRLIRWLLLPKTKVKLYFWMDEESATVNVISVWGSQRGREPRL